MNYGKYNHLISYKRSEVSDKDTCRNTHRDVLLIGGNILFNLSKVFWTKDGKYWARSKQEIDLFEKYKTIYCISYIMGLQSPFGERFHLCATAKDGYEMHIIGKYKFKYRLLNWIKKIL